MNEVGQCFGGIVSLSKSKIFSPVIITLLMMSLSFTDSNAAYRRVSPQRPSSAESLSGDDGDVFSDRASSAEESEWTDEEEDAAFIPPQEGRRAGERNAHSVNENHAILGEITRHYVLHLQQLKLNEVRRVPGSPPVPKNLVELMEAATEYEVALKRPEHPGVSEFEAYAKFCGARFSQSKVQGERQLVSAAQAYSQNLRRIFKQLPDRGRMRDFNPSPEQVRTVAQEYVRLAGAYVNHISDQSPLKSFAVNYEKASRIYAASLAEGAEPPPTPEEAYGVLAQTHRALLDQWKGEPPSSSSVAQAPRGRSSDSIPRGLDDSSSSDSQSARDSRFSRTPRSSRGDEGFSSGGYRPLRSDSGSGSSVSADGRVSEGQDLPAQNVRRRLRDSTSRVSSAQDSYDDTRERLRQSQALQDQLAAERASLQRGLAAQQRQIDQLMRDWRESQELPPSPQRGKDVPVPPEGLRPEAQGRQEDLQLALSQAEAEKRKLQAQMQPLEKRLADSEARNESLIRERDAQIEALTQALQRSQEVQASIQAQNEQIRSSLGSDLAAAKEASERVTRELQAERIRSAGVSAEHASLSRQLQDQRRDSDEALRAAREREERSAREGLEWYAAQIARAAQEYEAHLKDLREEGTRKQQEINELRALMERQRAQALAQQGVSAADKAQSDAQLATLNERLRTALVDQGTLQAEQVALKGQNDQLKEVSKKLEKKLALQRSKHQGAVAQLARKNALLQSKYSTAARMRKKASQTLSQLRRDLSDARSESQALVQQKRDLEMRERDLTDQLDSVRTESRDRGSAAEAERARIASELDQVRQQHQTLERTHLDLERQLRDQKTAAERLTLEQKRIEQERAEALRDVALKEGQLADLNQQLSQWSASARQKDGETQQLRARLAQLEQEFLQARQRFEENEERSRVTSERDRAEADQLRTQLRQTQAQVGTLEQQNASLKKAESTALQTVQRKQQEITRHTEKIANLNQQIQGLRLAKSRGDTQSEEQLRALVSEKAGLTLANAELQREKDQAQQGLVEIRAALQSAESAHHIALEEAQRDTDRRIADQVSAHETALAAAAQREQQLQRDRDGLRQAQERSAHEIDEIRRELEALRGTQGMAQAELDQLRSSGRGQDQARIRELQTEITRAQTLQGALRETLATLSQEKKDASQRALSLATEIAQARDDFQREREQFSEKDRHLQDQLAQEKSARLKAGTNAFLAVALAQARKKRAAEASAQYEVWSAQQVAQKAESEEQQKALRENLARLEGELRRAHAQVADLKVANQALASRGPVSHSLEPFSGGIHARINKALNRFESFLGKDNLQALQDAYRGKPFNTFLKEVVEPVCRLSLKSADREGFIEREIQSKTAAEQMEIFDDCIEPFLRKYTGAKYQVSLVGQDQGVIRNIGNIADQRKERLKEKIKLDLDPNSASSQSDSQLAQFVDRFVEDEAAALVCEYGVTSPFQAIESLKLQLHKIRERASSPATRTRFQLQKTLSQSLAALKEDFVNHPYEGLNLTDDCKKDPSAPDLSKMSREKLEEYHSKNLELLKNPVMVKKIQELNEACQASSSSSSSSMRSEHKVDVQLERGSPPQQIDFIFYCGQESGEHFAYLVPKRINHTHYAVGTPGTFKDHYWGIRVDGEQDSKPFLYRQIRPKGRLCRGAGVVDEAEFDKTQDEQQNEDLIEKRAYEVTGRTVDVKGKSIRTQGGASYKDEMVEYLGVDLTSYLGKLKKEDLKKCLGDISTQLKKLHANDIVVRDLKPQNVIFRPSVREGREASCIFIDFGASLMLKDGQLFSAGLNFTDQYSPIDLALGLKSPAEREKVVKKNLDCFRKAEKKFGEKYKSTRIPGPVPPTIDTLASVLVEKGDLTVVDPGSEPCVVESRFLSPQLDLYQTGYLMAYTALRDQGARAISVLDQKLKDLKSESASSNISRKVNDLFTFMLGKGMPREAANKAAMLLFVLDQKKPGVVELADRKELVLLANLCLYVNDQFCQYWNPEVKGQSGSNQVRSILEVKSDNSVTIHWELISVPNGKSGEKMTSEKAQAVLKEKKEELVVP